MKTDPAALRAILDDATAAARATPWWRCPYGRRALLACLSSSQPTIRVGNRVWFAARTDEAGRHLFTYRQVEELREALITVSALRVERLLNNNL